jgi:nucleoside-diphosphate-sugar epimerase
LSFVKATSLVAASELESSAGVPEPVYGDGSHRREYLAVEDLCQVISEAAARNLPTGIYNCTSGIAFQITEVIDIVAEAL